MINKKNIAREWLYFLLFLVTGIIAVPALLMLLFFDNKSLKELGDFYLALYQEKDAWVGWVFIMTPYGLFQLIRSIAWSWKQLKARPD